MVDHEHEPSDSPKRPAHVELSGLLLVLAILCGMGSVIAWLFARGGALNLILGLGVAGLLWGLSNALLMLGEIRQALRDQKPRNAPDDNA